MKKFAVPVVIATAGYVVIEAEDLAGAHDKAKEIQKLGLKVENLIDPISDTDCLLDEIMEAE